MACVALCLTMRQLERRNNMVSIEILMSAIFILFGSDYFPAQTPEECRNLLNNETYCKYSLIPATNVYMLSTVSAELRAIP